MEKIKLIPALPPQIADAVDRNRLAVFLGAGVSRVLGCAGWDDLSENLITLCTRTRKSDGSPCLDMHEASVLRRYGDNKKKITICKQILTEAGCEADFYGEVKRSLAADPDKLRTRNIYDELWELRALFITTNMDEHFDAKFVESRIVHKGERFERNPDRNCLYHIHGKISDPASVVLTIPQYMARYNVPEFQDSLKAIFGTYTVLFIGYSLEEFEVLDFVMNKCNPGDSTELKHYILKPFRIGEERTLKFEEYFYNLMQINVIPYHIGGGDYGQLYDVIRAWNQEINQTTTYLHESFNSLEASVENPTVRGIEDALQFIQNDAPHRRHLFKLLRGADNPQPWLKILHDHGYLDPDRNPRPQKAEGKTGYYTVPYWEVLGFLENVAAKNLKAPSEEIADLILNVLESIIYYRTDAGERIENHHTDASMAKVIFSLPLDKITSAHYEFVRDALKASREAIHIATAIEEVALPRFIAQKEKEHLLKLIGIVFEYRRVDEATFEEYVSWIEFYWMDKIFKGRVRAIADICGREAAGVALAKIRRIVISDGSQFNHIWIPAIEKKELYERYDLWITRFVKTILEDSDPESTKEMVEELLYEEHPIFNRIAIHAINYHYDALKEVFWGLDYNPLIKYQLDHEVSELFKTRCASFSPEEIARVVRWINEISAPDSIDPDQKELHSACRRKWWLSAITATGDPEVLAEYARYDAIYPVDVRIPEDGPANVSSVGDMSPITKEELLDMPTSEIVEYLCSYEEESGFRSLSSKGLAWVFTDCVAAIPDKFYSILKQRPKLPALYMDALLRGLARAGKGGFALDWSLTLNYILYLLKSKEFLSGEAGDEFGPGAVIAIADLITDGAGHDEYRSRPELRSKTEKILTILADGATPEFNDAGDITAPSTMFSLRSVTFQTMISYSLSIAPISEEESGYRWVRGIRDQFSRWLSRPSERSHELLAVVGRCLPQLCYLDEDWVTENLDTIFPGDDEGRWRSAFRGYIQHATSSRRCYRFLQDHGDYSIALGAFDDEPEIQKLLIASICRGYLSAEEEIDDPGSLLPELIERGDPEQVSTTIQAIWYFNRHDPLNTEMKERVKALWGRIMSCYTAREIDSDKRRILVDLFDWISIFDEIDDEIYEWLKISVAHVRYSRGGLHFFDYLLEHAEKTPEKVAELILINLDAGNHFSYKEQQLQRIVDILYRSGQKERADRICNSYLAAGYKHLMDIYLRNN